MARYKSNMSDLENILRRFVISLREAMPPSISETLSYQCIKKVMNDRAFAKSRVIGLYYPKSGEVRTEDLLKSKDKILALPCVYEPNIVFKKFNGFDNMKIGKFGIMEPANEEIISKKDIELFILPGVIFDRRGFRMGFGKGYFDRVLLDVKVPKYALSFSFQVFDKIPFEKKSDIFVDKIFTEKEIINCKRKRKK